MNALFFTAASVAILATIMVITRRNAVHALLYLILSLISVAVIFYTLGAPYVAALEIIVYAGAIVILFVFVVMMLNLSRSPVDEKNILGFKSWIIPFILSSVLLGELIYSFTKENQINLTEKIIGPKQVGISLYTTYLLGAELAGILLLAGIVGAYHLGRTKKENLHQYQLSNNENQ